VSVKKKHFSTLADAVFTNSWSASVMTMRLSRFISVPDSVLAHITDCYSYKLSQCILLSLSLSLLQSSCCINGAIHTLPITKCKWADKSEHIIQTNWPDRLLRQYRTVLSDYETQPGNIPWTWSDLACCLCETEQQINKNTVLRQYATKYSHTAYIYDSLKETLSEKLWGINNLS